MVVQIIAKDKNEKFEYQGKCKLMIDSVSKLLLVEPYNEEFKMISAMFKWKFVAQKKILFVFAEFEFQDFALVFDNTKICKKIYKILIQKGVAVGNQNLIKTRFLPLLFNEIGENPETKMHLQEILFKWIQLFGGQEKEEYIQILKENNVSDLFCLNFQRRSNLRKQSPKNDESKTTENLSSTGRNSNENRSTLKRPYNLLNPREIVEAPNFEIIKYFHKDVLKTKLSIFPNRDKKYCYELFWSKTRNYFLCYSCHHKRNYMSAKIIERNGKDAIALNNNQHVCELKEYPKIIEKSDFEFVSYKLGGALISRLIVFLDPSRTTCYEYSVWFKKYYCCGCRKKNGTFITYIYQKEDGTDFIMLKSSDHICEPKKYDPKKYIQKEIVEARKFKIFKLFQNGIDKSKLVIFTSSARTMCYEYGWDNRRKVFYCCGCKNKKWNTAEVFYNTDGSNYIILNKRRKHMCEPQKYDNEKFQISEKTIKSSDFIIFKYKHNGIETSKLIVFCETNKNLCYEYYWNKATQMYYCINCPIKNQVSAILCQKTNDSMNSVILNKDEHVCDLLEFDPEKYQDDVIVEKSMYNITTTTLGKLKDRILMIFLTEERKLYYKFIYKQQEKYYYCAKCMASKVQITATLQNEGKENEELYVNNQKHICDPFEYSTLTNGYIITVPNYQLVKRKHNGKIIQKMAVFTNEEKSECFEYTWHEKKSLYICNACQFYHNINVYGKIFKNNENEECVELSKTVHKCKPIKFIAENLIPKVIKQPDFKQYEVISQKKSVKRLAISMDQNMGYIYFYIKKQDKFFCHPCLKKFKIFVTAKILQNENGDDYVELGNNEHECEMQKL